MLIRFDIRNDAGEETYIKKLFNLACVGNGVGRKVNYDRNLANSINNDLFKKEKIIQYMKANNLKKPTLVKKSEDKEYLVLNIPISVKSIENVPYDYKNLYIDKTK